MFKSALQGLRQIHVLTAIFLFAPTLVFVSLCVAEDYFCVLSLVEDRYRVIWLSVVSVVATSALIEVNKDDMAKLVGTDPVFGTNFLALSFLSLNINGVLAALFILPYRFITILTGAPCSP